MDRGSISPSCNARILRRLGRTEMPGRGMITVGVGPAWAVSTGATQRRNNDSGSECSAHNVQPRRIREYPRTPGVSRSIIAVRLTSAANSVVRRPTSGQHRGVTEAPNLSIPPGTGPLARVVREAGGPSVLGALAARLSAADLGSLLMEVYRRRAGTVSPADLLRRYESDRLSRPSRLDPGSVAALEAQIWDLLPSGYRAVELAPVCPLGTNSVIATVDQNKVVATIRNTEVVADVTNVLALEAASIRRRLRSTAAAVPPVLLAASLRVLRAQVFSEPNSWAHFRLLGLCAAGRDQGGFRFEAAAMTSQIAFLVEAMTRARPGWQPRVRLTDFGSGAERLESLVLAPLAQQMPHGRFEMDPGRHAGRGYYVDACFKLLGVDEAGSETEIADGGCTTWTRRLLSDDKERLVIAGMGLDRLLLHDGLPAPPAR